MTSRQTDRQTIITYTISSAGCKAAAELKDQPMRKGERNSRKFTKSHREVREMPRAVCMRESSIM